MLRGRRWRRLRSTFSWSRPSLRSTARISDALPGERFRLLDQPIDEIAIAMLTRTQHAIDLRQVTPFAGVITDAERNEALRSVSPSEAA